MSSSATEAIAEFVAATTLEDIDDATVDAASRVVTDTVGVMLAGLTSEVAPSLLKVLDDATRSGPANVVGLGVCATPEVAAMVNGTLGHALDFDDVIEMYPGHPSSIVVGALLASASPARLDGDVLLEAYIVGIEAGARIGKAIGDGHYARGFHATSTVGIFAAVVALAKLHGLSAHQTRQALGIAGSFASGLRCNFGTMTKPLHSGWAARSATVAVDLAGAGFTANDSVLDAQRGFFAAFGDEHSDASSVAGSLGRPYVFTSPGVGLKRYPCYNGVQRAIDAAREVVQANAIEVSSIDEITCLLPPGRLQAVLYDEPVTGLQGKFSYRYVVAAAIVDGSVGIESFTDAAVNRPEVRRLMKRTTVREDPRCAGKGDQGRTKRMGTGGFMSVVVRTVDGEEHSANVARALGSPDRPLSWDEVAMKFADCAKSAGFDDSETARAGSALRSLSEEPDVRAVICGLKREGTH